VLVQERQTVATESIAAWKTPKRHTGQRVSEAPTVTTPELLNLPHHELAFVVVDRIEKSLPFFPTCLNVESYSGEYVTPNACA